MRLFLCLLTTTLLSAASLTPGPFSRTLGFLEPTAQSSATNPNYNLHGFSQPFVLTPTSIEANPGRLRFSTTAPTAVTGQPTAFAVHRFSGAAADWRRNINAFESIAYSRIQPGVDLQITPRRDRNLIELTATIAPATAPTVFYLEPDLPFSSSSPTLITFAQTGNALVLATPTAWQLRNGQRVLLTAEFSFDAATGRLTVRPGSYDNTQPLYLAANLLVPAELSLTRPAALTSSGNTYLAGSLPTPTVCRVTTGGTNIYCRDAWVAGFNAVGSALFFAQLGGEFFDTPSALALAPNGDLVIAGNTESAGFPTTADALQRANAGPLGSTSNLALPGGDAFIARLNATTGDLLFSTFYGLPNAHEDARALSIQDNVLVTINNNALVLLDANLTRAVAARTFTDRRPSRATLLTNNEVSYWESDSAALVRLSPDFAAIRTSLALGANARDNPLGQYLLPDGNLFVIWATTSSFELAEVSADGTREVRRTSLPYPGGTITSFAMLPGGGFVVALNTLTPTLPTTPNAILPASCKGFLQTSPVLQRFSSTGEPTFSTYLPSQIGELAGIVALSDSVLQFLDASAQTSYRLDLNAATPPSLACVTGGANRVVATAIAPGQIITLLGSGFGTTNTEVYVNGVKTPVLYSGSSQINAVVPYEGVTPGVNATIEVRPANLTLTTPVRSGAIEIFTWNASGSGPAAAFNQDGTLNTADNPAPANSIVVLYGTGIGATSPASVTGATAPLTPPFAQPLQPVTGSIGSVPCEVLYAGAAPGLINGAAQFNLRVPADLRPGAQGVLLNLGSARSAPGATIWVR